MKPKIRIDGVSKKFRKLVALRDVTFDVQPGERVAFVGPNGSGKTTLLRAIMGLVRVDGRVLIEGVDVARSPVEALAHVAYVPQIAPPIDVPVASLVRSWSGLRGIGPGDVGARAERLGLDLDAQSRKRFRDLSGGMKQKLLAALALASPASVLICDEPTANLDAAARASFFEQVAERPASDVVLLCSHRVEEVLQLVQRFVELRDGVVARDGALGALLRDGDAPEDLHGIGLH